MKTPFTPENKESHKRQIKPKKFWARLLKPIPARTHSDMEDDAPSGKIVKMLVVILIVHLVVIGGVALRGSLKKDSIKPMASIPIQTEKVAITQIPTIEELPALAIPVEDPNTTSASDVVEPTDVQVSNHITRESDIEAVNPRPNTDAKAGIHKVRTGDTWASIARDNKCSVAALKSANSKASLMSNTILSIPSATGATNRANATVKANIQSGPKIGAANDIIYVLKSGDNLSRVARKYKTTTAAIQNYNKITDAQVKKLAIGTQIRIPKK